MKLKKQIISILLGIIIGVPISIVAVNNRTEVKTQPVNDAIKETTTEISTEIVVESNRVLHAESFTSETTTCMDETESNVFEPYTFIPLSAELQTSIYEICTEQEIAYDLALAIIKTESEFDVNAVGDNGQAIGLCQIWDYWWGDTAEDCGLDINKPIDNVELMLIILNSHLKKCDGDLNKALQMYNSGNPTGNQYKDRVFDSYNWINCQKDENKESPQPASTRTN